MTEYLESDEKRKWGDKAYENRTLSLDQQYAFLDTIERVKLEILETWKPKVTPLFYKIWQGNIHGIVNRYRFSPIYKIQVNDPKKGLADLTTKEREFLHRIPPQNDTLALADQYVDYLDRLGRLLFGDLSLTTGTGSTNWLNYPVFQRSTFKGKIAERILANDLFQQISGGGIDGTTQTQLDEYLKAYPQGQYIAALKKKYTEKLAFAV